jgi:hypothetical protein
MLQRGSSTTGADSHGASFQNELDGLSQACQGKRSGPAPTPRSERAQRLPRSRQDRPGRASKPSRESTGEERPGASRPQCSEAVACHAPQVQSAPAEEGRTEKAVPQSDLVPKPQVPGEVESPVPLFPAEVGTGAEARNKASATPTIERTSFQLQAAANLAFAVRLTHSQPATPVPAASAPGDEEALQVSAQPAMSGRPNAGLGAAAVESADEVEARVPAAGTAGGAHTDGFTPPGESEGAAPAGKPPATSKVETIGRSLPSAAPGVVSDGPRKAQPMEITPGLAMPADSLATASAATAVRKPSTSIEAVSPVAGPEPAVAPPANRIDLRVQGLQGETVNIRLVSQRDAVQVAVHSAANGLVNDLRNGLQELVQTLKETGYQAETWRPTLSSSASSEPRNERGAEQQHPPTGGGNSRQDAPGGQHENRDGSGRSDRQLPHWVEELEASLAGKPEMNWREFLDGDYR